MQVSTHWQTAYYTPRQIVREVPKPPPALKRECKPTVRAKQHEIRIVNVDKSKLAQRIIYVLKTISQVTASQMAKVLKTNSARHYLVELEKKGYVTSELLMVHRTGCTVKHFSLKEQS